RREGRGRGHMQDDAVIRGWFCREVLPLERSLARSIGRSRGAADDVMELTHAVYAVATAGGRGEMPRNTRQYLFTVARNHLINRSKRAGADWRLSVSSRALSIIRACRLISAIQAATGLSGTKQPKRGTMSRALHRPVAVKIFA